MAQTITVTEAVRNFSELLNNIRYRGERYTILKGGKPAATIGPADGSARERRLSELRRVMQNIPRLEDDSESFAKDIARVVTEQPPIGEGTISLDYSIATAHIRDFEKISGCEDRKTASAMIMLPFSGGIIAACFPLTKSS